MSRSLPRLPLGTLAFPAAATAEDPTELEDVAICYESNVLHEYRRE